MIYVPAVCDTPDGDRFFDVPFTEADDHTNTQQAYLLYASTVGGADGSGDND